MGASLLGSNPEISQGGWETKTYPHFPIHFPPLQQPGIANGGQGAGLPDGQGDGRISDHTGSGFKIGKRQRESSTNPNSLAHLGGAHADTKPEEEDHLPGSKGVTIGPIKWTFESGPTGTMSTGSTRAATTSTTKNPNGTSATR